MDDIKHEKTKYTVGDLFERDYDGCKWLCMLTSRDYSVIHKRYVWHSTMNAFINVGGISGGSWTDYYEEDLDALKHIGNVIELIRKR